MPAIQDYPHWKCSNHFPIAIAITIDKMTMGAPQNHWLSLSGVPEIGVFRHIPHDNQYYYIPTILLLYYIIIISGYYYILL